MTDWNDAAKAEIPKSIGNYLKFEQGPNKFRILSNPIMGYEYWTEVTTKEKSKPVRSLEIPFPIPLDADLKKGWSPRYFWAFVVYNLDAKKIQILEITQKGLIKALQDLVTNEDYGDPKGYTITVTREGEGLESTYTLMPSPPKATPNEVLKMYEETPVNLEALFEGKDPFNYEAEDVKFDPKDVPFD